MRETIKTNIYSIGALDRKQFEKNKRLFVQIIIFINFQITRFVDFSMSKLIKLLKLTKILSKKKEKKTSRDSAQN